MKNKLNKNSFLSHLNLLKEYVKITLASAMEYRLSYIIQTITMFLNDCVWILLWVIFFNKFNEVNGWQLNEMIMLYAVVTLSVGIGGFFFGNRNRIAKVIAEGRLDFYLPLPKNVLFHCLISRSSSFSLGDILFGLVMGLLVLSWWQWPLFLLLVMLSSIIVISFGIIVSSLGFYWGNAENTAERLFHGLLAFSTYPYSIFKGLTRLLILLVIPAGFVSGIPVELLKSFNWQWLLVTIIFTILILLIAIFIFYKGLKRYESGSMITLRT
ncbi:MAG: ABC-2 family transporter protein [Candidatus Woesearchaeota archaeon]